MKPALKVALLDIENFPNKGAFWDGMFEQNILWVEEYGGLASFAYKWLGESRLYGHGLCDYTGNRAKKLLAELHAVMMEADVIIAHNGDAFDIKKANAYFIRYGFAPLPPRKTVDTLKIAKKYFRFNSNKLDNLGDYLGLGRKIQTGGLPLWQDCMATPVIQPAWDLMLKYNKQDVVLLEKVYFKLLPWIQNHPNLNVFLMRKDTCPNCMVGHLQKRGFELAGKKLIQRYQCQNVGCGAWTNEKKILKSKHD